MKRSQVIGLIALVVVVLLIRAMFTGHSSTSTTYTPATSTSGSTDASTAAPGSAPTPAAPAPVAADPNNLIIGHWVSTNSVAPDRPGACSTEMTFTANSYSRHYDGNDESGTASYMAGPTKVWVILQGLQPTSYGITDADDIVAQDYPPCTYHRQ
jgi:hypothetical protein